MTKLSKIALAALVATGSLTAALPAQAQSYGYQNNRYDDRYDRRDDDDDDRYDRDRYDDRYERRDYRGNANAIARQIEQLRYQVERTDYRDRISEREAAGLRRAVWNLRQQFRDYSRNGLSPREAAVLQDRIHEIRQRLRYERRDRDGRRW